MKAIQFFRTSVVSCLLLVMMGIAAYSQNIRANGKVTDAAGEPMIGVGVVQKGTTNGVITDVDGSFSISVPQGTVLVFSSVSYKTVEMAASTSMNIVMEEDRELLDEVVVVGYGVQKKSQVTGAISSVRAEDMENRTITNVEDALQGKTAGVQLISASASPGASPTVRVRGYSSNTTSDPLYVVDGVRMRSIAGIDPNDIESMEVLKDAASAAIYGAEAGNGVVLITTKKGKSGDGRISYSFQYTVQQVGKIPEVLNAKQYAQYMVEGNLLQQNFVNENWDGKTDTDWSKEVYGNGMINKHSVSFSNGNENGNYYVSLTYLDNDGIIKGRKDYFNRLSASINAEQKIKPWLTIGTTNQIDRFKREAVAANSFASSLVGGILQMDPLTPVSYKYSELPKFMLDAEANGFPLLHDDDGNYWASSPFNPSGVVNPFVLRDNNVSTSKGFRLSGSAYANVNIMEGLVFTSRLGYQFSHNDSPSVSLPYFGNSSQSTQYLAYNSNISGEQYYQWENFANFNRSFGLHNVSAMAGMSFLSRTTNYIQGSLAANGEDALMKNDPTFYYFHYKAASATQTVDGEELTTAQYSWFGRLGYDYDGKYMIQASLRADAADLSYLSKSNRWGYFPAVSAGWTVSKESFFEPIKNVVNDLKLRASWGQNGSLSALGNYAYSTTITTSGFYPLVEGNVWTPARFPSSMGNDKMKWETSEQLDLGIDARFLNDRLTFSVDWFDKKTKDLLIWNTTPSLSIGGTISPVNAGNVSNRGFEFELSWKDKIGKDFGYSIKGNVSTLKNKVTYLDESLSRVIGLDLNNGAYPLTYFEEGYPVYYFRGYKFSGVDSASGDPLFEDLDNDGLIGENDKTYIGDGIPTLNYGLTFTASYKGLDFTLFAQGAYGNDIFLGVNKINFPKANRLTAAWWDGRWTESNRNASVPRANSNEYEKYCMSDAMVYDGSYLKIKQIQLGYTLPSNLLSKIGLKTARVYVSLEDFFTFTKYIGFDPEASANSTTGIGVDLGGYPTSKKAVFGVNIDF
ncbi:MAG: TonB-dependent receptor [Bacteroidales bacterium]|nr:TonB-dependent receptor [Bacteroidales bacterium]